MQEAFLFPGTEKQIFSKSITKTTSRVILLYFHSIIYKGKDYIFEEILRINFISIKNDPSQKHESKNRIHFPQKIDRETNENVIISQ